MHLIVGLGNPGKKYEKTRHNAGFLVLDELATQEGVEFKNKTSLEADVAQTDSFTLMKPQTFMNVSGRSVKAYMAKHKCSPENLLIIYDDADIPFGEIRYKEGGSSGGHNGMQSILDLFQKGTSVARVRVGIGRPVHIDVPLDVYVLQQWTHEEEKKLPDMIAQAIEKIRTHVSTT